MHHALSHEYHIQRSCNINAGDMTFHRTKYHCRFQKYLYVYFKITASEVTTLWRYRNLCIVIIIICNDYQFSLADKKNKKLKHHRQNRVLSQNVTYITSSGKRNVTVWRPSVCLSHWHTHRDSPGGSTRRGQHTVRPDNKEDLFIILYIHLYPPVIVARTVK